MILSIGMIVKNEEKYLEKCLNAMKPMLENVDSELIIADTGSTDSTMEIAKRFTENVYYFEWINDFSVARNSTLEKAKGEWYMFIDADEIIQSCDDIIHFFNSGEYKNYSSATYIQRSYQSIVNGEIDFNTYNDFRPLRLTKKVDKVKFKGNIHESLTPLYTPVKHLNLIADHFGYVFYEDGKTTASAIEKSKRNLNPLLKIIQNIKPGEKPDNSIYKEIADCYTILNDYEKSLEYLDKGFKSIDKSSISIIPFYSDKIYILFYLKRYNEMIALCDEYFSPNNFARKTEIATDILIHYFRGGAFFRIYRFNEAITDFYAFFDLYKKYKSDRLNTDDLLYSTLLLSNFRLRNVLLCFYDSCIKTGKYDIAAQCEIPFSISGLFDDQNELLKYLQMKMEVMKQTDYSGLSDLYSQLDESTQKQLICSLRWKLFEADKNKREDIIQNLESAVKNSKAAAIDICKNYFLKGSIDAVKIEKYLNEYGSDFNADILYIMIYNDMDITSFVNAKDFLPNECIHAVLIARNDFLSTLEKYNINIVSEKGLEKTAEMYKYTIAVAASLKKSITKLIAKYGDIGLKWQSKFKESSMPNEIKSAVIASDIVTAFEKRDYRLCTNQMNKLLTSFPEFAPIIASYKSEIEIEMKKDRGTSSLPDTLSEFQQMAIVVKQNIREMIKSGNIADAESVLSEYAALCPDDDEIKSLFEEINALK